MFLSVTAVADETTSAETDFFAGLERIAASDALDGMSRPPVVAKKPRRFRAFATIDGKRVELFRSSEEQRRLAEQFEKDRRLVERMSRSVDRAEQGMRMWEVQRVLDAAKQARPVAPRTEYWPGRRP
jgi:hypothetical protein